VINVRKGHIQLRQADLGDILAAARGLASESEIFHVEKKVVIGRKSLEMSDMEVAQGVSTL
jgi:hypothetical protein